MPYHLCFWDEDLAGRLIRAVVDKNLALFDQFRDLAPEDLRQDLLLEIRRLFRTFDPARASFSKWVSMVAHRRLLNRQRDRARRAAWEGVAATRRPPVVPFCETYEPHPEDLPPVFIDGEIVQPDAPKPTPDVVEGEVIHWDGHESAGDWLETVYSHAKYLTRGPEFRERRTYEAAQALSVAALNRKLGMSTRGIQLLFETRPDLCRVIAFPPIPSHRWFARAIGADGTQN